MARRARTEPEPELPDHYRVESAVYVRGCLGLMIVAGIRFTAKGAEALAAEWRDKHWRDCGGWGWVRHAIRVVAVPRASRRAASA